MLRVAVTGIGAISALGRTVEEFGRALREGRSGIGPIPRASASRMEPKSRPTIIAPTSMINAPISSIALRSSL
jgi:3-oxoacyl-(acyl-carrier-protein) synthase